MNKGFQIDFPELSLDLIAWSAELLDSLGNKFQLNLNKNTIFKWENHLENVV